LLAKFDELWQSCHGAIIILNFTNNTGRLASGKSSEIHCRLCDGLRA